MRPRLQFSLRFLLTLIMAAARFLGGMVYQKQLDQTVYVRPTNIRAKAIFVKATHAKDQPPTLAPPPRLRWAND